MFLLKVLCEFVMGFVEKVEWVERRFEWLEVENVVFCLENEELCFDNICLKVEN